MLDEPENGLDFAAASMLNRVLEQQARSGRYVVISSHSIGEILDMCNDIVVLRGGVVEFAGSLKDVTHNLGLTEYFDAIRKLVIK